VSNVVDEDGLIGLFEMVLLCCHQKATAALVSVLISNVILLLRGRHCVYQGGYLMLSLALILIAGQICFLKALLRGGPVASSINVLKMIATRSKMSFWSDIVSGKCC
jgi:hypothetical protein